MSGRAAPGSPNNALLQGLLQVPDLASTEDREQSAGIVSLSALLQVCQLDDAYTEVVLQSTAQIQASNPLVMYI